MRNSYTRILRFLQKFFEYLFTLQENYSKYYYFFKSIDNNDVYPKLNAIYLVSDKRSRV